MAIKVKGFLHTDDKIVSTDGDADGEIDVTIGAGTASVTTVAGAIGQYAAPGGAGSIIRLPYRKTKIKC